MFVQWISWKNKRNTGEKGLLVQYVIQFMRKRNHKKEKKDLKDKKKYMLANTYRVAINCAWVHMFGFAVLLQQHSQKHVCAQILRPLTPLYYIPTCQRPLTPLICWTHQTTSLPQTNFAISLKSIMVKVFVYKLVNPFLWMI